jgi:predicted CXXCH cytochrome family protein
MNAESLERRTGMKHDLGGCRWKEFPARALVVSLAAAALVLGVVSPAAAQQQSHKGVAAGNCVNDKCHAKLGKAKFLHGPVGAGQCGVCHQPGKNYKPGIKCDFVLVAYGKDLCLKCHEDAQGWLKNKYVHGPVAMGDCTACHLPHQSDYKFLLKEGQTSKFCFSCHDNVMMKRKFLHGPVAAGNCNVCHDPHASVNKFRLPKPGDELCFNCHKDRMSEFNKKYVHKPVGESCLYCHDAHSTEAKYILKSDGATLCLGCHKKMADQLSKVSVPHSALKEGICTNCHTSHASDFPRQLKASAKDVCFTTCHNHRAMGDQIANAKKMHGPVGKSDCYACHDSHGTNYTMILRKFFPPKFYIEYKTENYAICWDCHNKDVALDEFTTTLTDFRNGNRNLHFVHVNKQKGRSCKACHEAHAGNQAKHIRAGVPYGSGGYTLPIDFTKTETGGNCVVGCHRELPYDRAKPVLY